MPMCLLCIQTRKRYIVYLGELWTLTNSIHRIDLKNKKNTKTYTKYCNWKNKILLFKATAMKRARLQNHLFVTWILLSTKKAKRLKNDQRRLSLLWLWWRHQWDEYQRPTYVGKHQGTAAASRSHKKF
jgi:hypothetical protein